MRFCELEALSGVLKFCCALLARDSLYEETVAAFKPYKATRVQYSMVILLVKILDDFMDQVSAGTDCNYASIAEFVPYTKCGTPSPQTLFFHSKFAETECSLRFAKV